MRKIKDFKLTVRFKEAARRAKKASVDLAAAGLSDEQALEAFSNAFAAKLHPAVLFESFGPQAPGAELAPLPGLGFSLGLATLGPEAEPAIAAVEEGPKRAFAELLCRVALDQAVGFAGGLIAEEAEAEKCDLSPFATITEAQALETIVTKLDGTRISVGLSDGRLVPAYSAAFSASWIAKPRSKSKK